MKRIMLFFAVACTATSCQTSPSSAQSNSTSLRKSTVLTILPTPAMLVNKENTDALFAELNASEKKGGNPTPRVDADITTLFEGQTMPGIDKPFESAIYRFNNDVTHRSILDEAEKMGVKKIYSYTEAIRIVLLSIEFDEVKQKNKSLIVYFKVNGNEQLYSFDAWRDNDRQLNVILNEVNLGHFGHDAGDGVCFSNN